MERWEVSWVLPPDMTGMEEVAAVTGLIWPVLGEEPAQNHGAGVGRNRLAAALSREASAITTAWDAAAETWVTSGLTPEAMAWVRLSHALQDKVSLHECAHCRAIYRQRGRPSRFCSSTCAARAAAAAQRQRQREAR